jgi:hypothetical protein
VAVVAFVLQLAVIGNVEPVPIVGCLLLIAVTIDALSQKDVVAAYDAEIVDSDEEAHDALIELVA